MAELRKICDSDLGFKPPSKARKGDIIAEIRARREQSISGGSITLTPKQRKRLRLKAHRKVA